MNKKIRWITETAILLALLVVLQALTKGFGQYVTGSCVNTILGVSVLVAGVWSGVTIAVISPVLAFLLGIAPQAVTVPAIMAGNAVFVLVLYFLAGGKDTTLLGKAIAWLAAAAAKFAVLWLLVGKIICGLASAPLLESGLLKAPMLEKLPAMFTWPQLVTALIGGGIALIVAPMVRKALHR